MRSTDHHVVVGGMNRMSPLDASFLQLERSSQQQHVGSALVFEGAPPAYDELCATIAARLDDVPRYRQRFRRVPLELARPVWADDVHFRLGYHIRHNSAQSSNCVRIRGADGSQRTEPPQLDDGRLGRSVAR